MYISPRAANVRNLLVSVANGSITLVILLIAPLGLAAVIVNTLLVIGATYGVTMIADRVIAGLQPSSDAQLLSESHPRLGRIIRQQSSSLNWRRRRE
jgi:hypothetical protein